MTTHFGHGPLSSLLDRNPLLEELVAGPSFPSHQRATTFSSGLSKQLYLDVFAHIRLCVLCFDTTCTHIVIVCF